MAEPAFLLRGRSARLLSSWPCRAGDDIRVGSRAEVGAMASDSTVPDFLRVEEAARVLRIGRTAAYELAREFLATAGKSGLPVVRVGRQLRVPRHHLEVLAGGPVSWPLAADHAFQSPSEPASAQPSAARLRRRNGDSAQSGVARSRPEDAGTSRAPPRRSRSDLQTSARGRGGADVAGDDVVRVVGGGDGGVLHALPGAGAGGGAGRVVRPPGRGARPGRPGRGRRLAAAAGGP